MLITQLKVSGSLAIQAKQPMGSVDSNGAVHFDENIGRCTLENVHIENDVLVDKSWLTHEKVRFGCKVLLEGNGEFIARNVSIKGCQSFFVPNHMQMTVEEENGSMRVKLTPLFKNKILFSIFNRLSRKYYNSITIVLFNHN